MVPEQLTNPLIVLDRHVIRKPRSDHATAEHIRYFRVDRRVRLQTAIAPCERSQELILKIMARPLRHWPVATWACGAVAMLFGSSPVVSFRGSQLEQIVRHCGDQMRLAANMDSPKVFARAVLAEHAAAFEQMVKADRDRYPADVRAANQIADTFAVVICAHMALTADAVNAFGAELDRAAQSDNAKAVALANSLAAWCSTDPIELSRTYRWLGDAWFEHGRFDGRPSWDQGALAFLRSEKLLQGRAAPVEQANLDFNFGNTIAALPGGADVGLMEAAETRYQQAASTFRGHYLASLAQTVEARQGTLRAQLVLARRLAQMQRDFQRMEDLLARLPATVAREQDQILSAFGELKAALDRGELPGTWVPRSPPTAGSPRRRPSWGDVSVISTRLFASCEGSGSSAKP
jgi:hypothetical protein